VCLFKLFTAVAGGWSWWWCWIFPSSCLCLHRCQFLTHFVITLSWSRFLAACKAQIRILLLPQESVCVQWSAETRLENSVHSFRALKYLPRSSIGAQTVIFLCVQWSAETRLENSVHSFRALRYLHGCILNCTFQQLIIQVQ
jgi:hypothetical protein